MPESTDKDLDFGDTVVADDDYRGNIHIRTTERKPSLLDVPAYAVFDDIEQVSNVFYAHSYGQVKAYADGYERAKFPDDV